MFYFKRIFTFFQLTITLYLCMWFYGKIIVFVKFKYFCLFSLSLSIILPIVNIQTKNLFSCIFACTIYYIHVPVWSQILSITQWLMFMFWKSWHTNKTTLHSMTTNLILKRFGNIVSRKSYNSVHTERFSVQFLLLFL